MTAKEVRALVKKIIIAQGGKIYNFNLTNLYNAYGLSVGQVQNAIHYFSYSPQQAKFRAEYNFH